MMSENPYNEKVESIYFHTENGYTQRYIEGMRDGWNDGVNRYFNMDSQNDCADTLYVYLSRLYEEADRKFGHGAPILLLIKTLLFNLDTAYIPGADNDVADEVAEDENWLQPFERLVECNA